jgi:hypothetical protein
MPSSSSDRTMYAGTVAHRLYISKDKGVTWTETGSIPGHELLALGSPDVLYAADRKGIYRSTDVGRSWKVLSCGWNIGGIYGYPDHSNELYVVTRPFTETSRKGEGLYVTTNSGRDWSRVTIPDGGEVYSLGLRESTGREHLYLGLEYGGLYEESGSDRWILHSIIDTGITSMRGPQVTSMSFGQGQAASLWVGTAFNGVFEQKGEGAWIARRPKGPWVKTVIVDPTRDRTVYTVSQDGVGLRTIDEGRHWSRMKGLPKHVIDIVRTASGSLYSWEGRRIYVSRDSGDTWQRLAFLR